MEKLMRRNSEDSKRTIHRGTVILLTAVALLALSTSVWAEGLWQTNAAGDLFAVGGNVGIGTSVPESTLHVDGRVIIDGDTVGGTSVPDTAMQVNGYLQIDLTAGVPAAADCNEGAELGRMIIDSSDAVIYICVDSGWKKIR